MFTSGFLKIAKISDEDKSALKRGALIGAGVGAVKHVGTDAYLSMRERKAANIRDITKFKKSLKPGDVLILGSSPKGSGAVTFGDLPPSVQKGLKAVGLGKSKSSKILTNSTMLNSIGAGSKYHGAVYLGKGRVAHMSTDMGAVNESLASALKGQNTAAYRLKKGKGTSQQTRSAVSFARSAVKKKVPYQAFAETAKEPLTNMLVPDVARKACRNTSKGMVCHTLPTMAYNKQKFSQGRRTYSGDIRRNTNFTPVARRDVVKIPMMTKFKGVVGNMGKGLSYALPGAAVGYGIHKYKQFKKEKGEV